MVEDWRPARLKVLLGAMQVVVTAAISGETEAMQVCLWPSSIRSEWISSEMISTPWRRQISPIVRSSSGVHTRPTGLWGLQRMKNLQPLAFSSKSAKSTV